LPSTFQAERQAIAVLLEKLESCMGVTAGVPKYLEQLEKRPVLVESSNVPLRGMNGVIEFDAEIQARLDQREC